MKKFIAVLAALIFISSFALADGYKVGDTLFLGQYEQDNDPSAKEPIEWQVLEVDGDRALILSKLCLEVVIFYPERVPMYWGKSDLRKWMNGEFYEQAFSSEEKDSILLSTIKNANPHGMKGAGQDTEDYVFLLSKEEVLNFFLSMPERVAYPTEYVKAKGCTLSPEIGSCRWWTRSNGARKVDMWGIRLDGRMTAYGMQDVDWPGNTMRPAMWIKNNNKK